MKKYCAVLLAAFGMMLALMSGCDDKNEDRNRIKFATCADYPPFEYYMDKNIVGFDIELAQLLAKKLHKKASFCDMSFGAILASMQDGSVDAAISAMSASEEKKKNFDFSKVYYRAGIAVVYRRDNPIGAVEQLSHKKVACQLGSTGHEKLLRQKAPTAELFFMDNMNAAVESLKAGHVDHVLLDSHPAKVFCEKNMELAYITVAEDSDGYSIAFKKGSRLREDVNKALEELESDGEMEKLKKKWLK